MILLLIGVPLIVASMLAAFFRSSENSGKLLGWLLGTTYWILALLLVISLVGGEGHSFKLDWVPSLGMNLDFRLEAFQLWFAALICFIGGCIQLYACAYFEGKESLKQLLIYLQIFTLAMLGIVSSNNLYSLFLFWELTSVCSFLLVGLNHQQAENRRKASQGLIITMLGGVGLLIAAILLQAQYETVVITELLAMPLAHTPATSAAMILLILACVTKSAQWPFHFWLPNAMAGPTPVSAFLHSATMVKAGVFLLAVFAPWFGQHPWWSPILVTMGAMTLAVSFKMGIVQNDLKAVLASTTLAALAVLTMMVGVATDTALKAFVIYLTAHALYKAPLFLAAGNIEKATGTRMLNEILGVLKMLPVTGTVVVLSMASLFGLPPFLGFLGKEYALTALWEYSAPLATLSSLLAAAVLAVGLRALIMLLGGGQKLATPLSPVPRAMTVACVLPALLSIICLALYPHFNERVLTPAAQSMTVSEVKPYAFWHGFQPALALSLLALVLAFPIVLAAKHWLKVATPWADPLYERLIYKVLSGAKVVASWLSVGKLNSHLTVIFFSVGLLAFTSLSITEWPSGHVWDPKESWIFLGLAPLLIISAMIAARAQTAISMLVSLGFVGLLVAFIYLWFSAPDLALTQLLAETLILFLITGSLVKYRPPKAVKPSWIRWMVSISSGVLVTLLVLKAQAVEWQQPASAFFLENSLTQAFGANAVNVILVDFRAIDTFGEITVLGIAALGVSAVFGSARFRAPIPRLLDSPWLSTSFSLLVIVLVPVIMLTFWRGHNEPGGGFIAALMFAILAGTGLLVKHPWLSSNRLRKVSFTLLALGLLIAGFSALIPLAFGKALLTGLWWHRENLHLGTPLIFDLGVFLTVVGFALNYLRHFLKPSTTTPS